MILSSGSSSRCCGLLEAKQKSLNFFAGQDADDRNVQKVHFGLSAAPIW